MPIVYHNTTKGRKKAGFSDFCKFMKEYYPVTYEAHKSIEQMLDMWENDYLLYTKDKP